MKYFPFGFVCLCGYVCLCVYLGVCVCACLCGCAWVDEGVDVSVCVHAIATVRISPQLIAYLFAQSALLVPLGQWRPAPRPSSVCPPSPQHTSSHTPDLVSGSWSLHVLCPMWPGLACQTMGFSPHWTSMLSQQTFPGPGLKEAHRVGIWPMKTHRCAPLMAVCRRLRPSPPPPPFSLLTLHPLFPSLPLQSATFI